MVATLSGRKIGSIQDFFNGLRKKADQMQVGEKIVVVNRAPIHAVGLACWLVHNGFDFDQKIQDKNGQFTIIGREESKSLPQDAVCEFTIYIGNRAKNSAAIGQFFRDLADTVAEMQDGETVENIDIPDFIDNDGLQSWLRRRGVMFTRHKGGRYTLRK